MAVNNKLPLASQVVDSQFFQVPQSDGLLAGFQYDAETKTFVAKESQVIVPSLHGITHISEDPIPAATTDSPGLLSADDKARLDSLLQMRVGVLGFAGSGFSDDGGMLVGDIILAAGSEFISIERVGNVVRFTVENITPLSCACFTEDAKVSMEDGTVKPIKDISIGDLVIAHNGSIQKVTKHLKRNYNGDLIKIKAVGHNEILVTPDHPIYSVNEKITKSRKKALKSIGLIKEIDEDWISAADLRSGDYISRRFSHTTIQERKQVDLLSEIPNCLEKDGKVYPSRKYNKTIGIDGLAYGVPRFIDIDKDLLRLLGYFLAEGCYSDYNGIRFTVNKKELRLGDIGHDILRIMRDKFGLEGAVYQRSNSENAVDINFRSKALGKFLNITCGSGAKTKKLPSWVLKLPSDLTLELLAGFIMGDGYLGKSKYGESEIRVEIPNENLVSQLAFIADKAGIPVRRSRPRKMGGFGTSICYRLFITTSHAPELFKLITGIDLGSKPHVYNYIKTEESVLTKIKSIDRIPFDGLVYNLEVEGEHTYIVNGLAVHNCEECANIYWIGDESEASAIRPPSCNGKMPGINGYGELKIYTYPESMILDPRDPLNTLNQKGNFPALIFKRYDDAVTPYENEIEAVLKRNANLTSNVGWAFTPGSGGKAECVWFVGSNNNGAQMKFELWPEKEPGLLGTILFNGHQITKQMGVIVDYANDILTTNNYSIKKWDVQNAKPLGSAFTCKNVWQYVNPENLPTAMSNPRQIVLDRTRELLPIGTLVNLWEFEINRTSNGRLTRSFFSLKPEVGSASLWCLADAIQFGDLFSSREEINDPQEVTAITASEVNVPDIRLFEKTIWGLNQFEDRLILSDDGGEVEATDGSIQREPSGEPINNDIVADIDPSIPGLRILKQAKSLVGDINGDGVVDDQDLHLFMCAYGKTVFDEGYNANADFNDDGRVDIRDLAILGQQFDLNVEKVSDRPVFLWNRKNHRNVLVRAKLGMPDDDSNVVFPPYDILLSAPVDSFDDTYVKVIKRGVFTTGPFAGAPYIVAKGMRWEDLPAEGVLRILTGAFRNTVWRYYFKAAFSNWDDDAVTLIGRDEVFPFDEDFPIGADTACTASIPSGTDVTGTDVTGVTDASGSTAEAVEVPENTTVVELLRQDYTSPCVRLQFTINRTAGANSAQLQFVVGFLDMSVAYEYNQIEPEDDLVRGFTPGYTVSRVFVQNGFITDGVGTDVDSTPDGFRVYSGGELDVPVNGQVEKWNDIEIMYRDGEVWVWWCGLHIPPDTVASASLSSPVTVNSAYFPLNPQVAVGKVAFRLFPGALVRQVQISDQLESFNEYSKSGIQLIN